MKLAWISLASSAVLAAFAHPHPVQAQTCTPRAFAGSFAGEVTLCQNWNADEQQKFWFLSQGSQIIPYDWFLSLEQANSERPFRDPAHMDGFRYLPQRPTELNPDGLPIGFTKDGARGNENYEEISDSWLGMTCAACHTGQVEFGGHRMLIDGAPTMADFEGFMGALVGALRATLNDDRKFDRFAAGVLGSGSATPEVKAVLRAQLASITTIREEWNERNRGDHPYGFARLDAIGAIFNEITVGALGVERNARRANAPVSYPFVWDTPQHDRVQWNGSVPNKGAGALGRNIGEVLGVFGSLTLDTDLTDLRRRGHKSSVDVEHLGEIEELLWKLQSPQWPETILPKVDRTSSRFSRGEDTFKRLCRECHQEIDRASASRRIIAKMVPATTLGTDKAMAENFANSVVKSGPLRLHLKTYVPIDLAVFRDEGKGVEFLRNAVTGVIFNNFLRSSSDTLKAINAGRNFHEELVLKVQNVPVRIAEQLRMAGTPGGPAEELAYKARPLNGIWATAPYLHNGSVRTMRQLLLPARQRQETFRVGSREYDPKDMGFVDAGGYTLDTRLHGNSNAGHEYGTDELSADPETREALLEYLKTL